MPEPSESTATGKSPVIIDLGTRPRKQVNRLRKGRGKLIDEVEDCIEELTSAGTIKKTAQPVVVVVTERPGEKFAQTMFPVAPMFVMPFREEDNNEEDEDED